MKSSDNAKRKIGDFLRRARTDAALSTMDAARHLAAISETDILEIEAGSRAVNLAELYAFANVYNIGPERLMTMLFDLTSLEPGADLEVLERVLREAK